MAKMSIGKFNGMVRKAINTPHVSRVNKEESLTADTLNDEALILADDDPDYDIATAGATVAEMQAGGRLSKLNLQLNYFAGTTNAAGARVKWILYKSPDGILGSIDPEDLFTADVTLTTAQLRKSAMAAGYFYSSANNDTKAMRVRVSKAAFRRNMVFADNDQLRFAIETSATGAKYWMTGTITWAR